MAHAQGRGVVEVDAPPRLTGLPAAMRDVLENVVPAIVGTCQDPWWIIGSSAMVLSGLPGIAADDIDVLCSDRDALALSTLWSRFVDPLYQPDATEARFRSRFARFNLGSMPLEVMGGLAVHQDGQWQPVTVADTRHVSMADILIPVPSWDEQIRLLHLFARKKDLSRAAGIVAFRSGAPIDVE